MAKSHGFFVTLRSLHTFNARLRRFSLRRWVRTSPRRNPAPRAHSVPTSGTALRYLSFAPGMEKPLKTVSSEEKQRKHIGKAKETTQVRARFAAGQELVKEDLSPVTVADLGVQALAVLYLRGKARRRTRGKKILRCKHTAETRWVRCASSARRTRRPSTGRRRCSGRSRPW